MKKCEFIEAEGRVWVPNFGSWLGNWARHLWLEQHFQKGSLSIADKDTWSRLIKSHDVRLVVEGRDGRPVELISYC